MYDDAILKNPWVNGILHWGAPWIQYYLEFSYFLCYPIVPLGVACLCFLQPRLEPRLKAQKAEVSQPATLKGAANSEPYGPGTEFFWTHSSLLTP